MCMKSPDYSEPARALELSRQNAITTGSGSIEKAFAGFDPAFYNQRAQAYQDFAMPQLSEQYNTTRKQLGYGVANRGLFGSSVEQDKYSDLNRQMGQNKQDSRVTSEKLADIPISVTLKVRFGIQPGKGAGERAAATR